MLCSSESTLEAIISYFSHLSPVLAQTLGALGKSSACSVHTALREGQEGELERPAQECIPEPMTVQRMASWSSVLFSLLLVTYEMYEPCWKGKQKWHCCDEDDKTGPQASKSSDPCLGSRGLRPEAHICQHRPGHHGGLVQGWKLFNGNVLRSWMKSV